MPSNGPVKIGLACPALVERHLIRRERPVTSHLLRPRIPLKHPRRVAFRIGVHTRERPAARRRFAPVPLLLEGFGRKFVRRNRGLRLRRIQPKVRRTTGNKHN